MSQPPPLHFPPEYVAQRRANDVPIPTDRAPPRRQPTRARSQSNAANLRRAKTLTRPERGIAPAPLINPPLLSSGGSLPSNQPSKNPADSWDAWRIFSHIVTFWAPPFLLSSIGGLKDKPSRQAWREKVALCFLAIVLGGTVGFATMGLDRVLCPQNAKTDLNTFAAINSTDTIGTVGIQGRQFNITAAKITQVNWYTVAKAFPGQDTTLNFTRTAADFPLCKGLNFKAAKDEPCDNTVNKCVLGAPNNATFLTEGIFPTGRTIGYDWDHISAFKYYLVVDGTVLNFEPYMRANPKPVANDAVDIAIRTVLSDQPTTGGKDGTKLFYNRAELQQAVPCLVQRYYAGDIDKISAGCFISTLFLYVSLVVIMGIVFARFAMACVFNWFMSSRLIAAPKNLNRRVISPAVMPEGANMNVDSKNGTAPWAAAGGGGANGRKPKAALTKTPKSATALIPSETTAPVISMATIGDELFCVCLITCYSEGEESIRGTLDSISMTTYSDTRKLLFVVCDGMITGAGEKRSTPDICVGLLEADPRFGNPAPMSYVAVGLGAKRENRAMVYAGHYTVKGKRTPTVILVKCGTDAEAMSDKKPGNRGKRDSQLMLMNFFSRVTYNDRMSPLDYDLFRKLQVLMGVTPDYFEVCLMVDADTKVLPDSLTYLVNCMHHDNLIMGVCGETRIANKRQSWVTAIQVYEYFISHHLAKAFESVFGGVTCLPGCFSMYRLKARKTNEDDWVPLLVKPEIVREYSQSEVTTLHQKNLLLLGEDRFLTTILLRTFPNRKMMFCPQAKCRTVAPDAFAVLLSQRRRWINSTIHNLMELVRVRNLCGTFCFSMQFVVFMDLLGTVVLPVAISLTYALVVSMVLDPPNTFEKAIPLMLLLAVIGLPAILILITTRKIVYVFWMFIYLAALPIWNFVLPVYSFWHFDDFSWGETRRVEGEDKQKGHDDGAGTLADGTQVPMRRWEDWERSRLRKLRREDKRKRELERSFPNAGGFLTARHHSMAMSDWNDDTVSIAMSEEDQWGTQIGAYNENASQWAPPPVALLLPHQGVIQSAETLRGDELQAMLEQGFELPQRPSFSTNSAPSSPRRGPSGLRYPPNEVPTMTSSSSVTLAGYPPSRQDAVNSATSLVGRSPLSPPGTPIGSASASSNWRERGGGERPSQEGMMGGMSPVEWGPLGPLDPAHNPQSSGSGGGGGGGKLQKKPKPAQI